MYKSRRDTAPTLMKQQDQLIIAWSHLVFKLLFIVISFSFLWANFSCVCVSEFRELGV